MKKLNLPGYPFHITMEGKSTYIFDAIRGKKLLLTPEEWVRQHLVQFLVKARGVPPALIRLEQEFRIHGKRLRTDIVAYSPQAVPLLLAECKAPEVKITKETLNQAINYNRFLKVPYILLSNGMEHFSIQLDYKLDKANMLKDIPHYKEMKTV